MIIEFMASSAAGIQPANEAPKVPYSPYSDPHFPDSEAPNQTRVSLPVSCNCPDSWTWNRNDKSPEVDLLSDPCACAASCQHQHSGQQNRTAVFHPCWSNGTAAVRGTKPLDAFSVHYWEVGKRLIHNALSQLCVIDLCLERRDETPKNDEKFRSQI
jgi:hypothetical protein